MTAGETSVAKVDIVKGAAALHRKDFVMLTKLWIDQHQGREAEKLLDELGFLSTAPDEYGGGRLVTHAELLERKRRQLRQLESEIKQLEREQNRIQPASARRGR